MADHRAGDASQERSLDPAAAPAAHDHDLRVGASDPHVDPRELATGLLYPCYLLLEPPSGISPGALSYRLVELDVEDLRLCGAAPTCTTCSSQSSSFESRTAIRAASSDPSVAGTTFVGNTHTSFAPGAFTFGGEDKPAPSPRRP